MEKKDVCPSCLEKKKIRELSESKWACLPDDLLISIFDKPRFSLSDYVRITSVCKSWKSIALSLKEKRMQLTNHQLPWLMISYWDSDACDQQQSLYNFTNGQISNFNFSIPHKYKSKKFHGSSHGWLIFSFSMQFEFRLVLLNPFSGAVIRLPLLEKETGTSSNKDIEKVILSSDPSFGWFQVLVSFAFSIRGKLVAHLNFGEKFWSYSQSFIVGRFYNSFIFYEDRLLCGTESKILSLNVSDSFDDEYSPSMEIIEEVPPLVSDNDRYSSKSFFVESTNGDLLMVYRSEKSLTYKIFKIVDSNGKLDLILVMNLDGHSLFLDDNQSISVLASNYPGCKPNSIYYLCNTRVEGRRSSVREIEEFNLEDQSLQCVQIDQLFDVPVQDNHELESWILPSMKLSKTLKPDCYL